jgi:PAS domain S-box-containing protein
LLTAFVFMLDLLAPPRLAIGVLYAPVLCLGSHAVGSRGLGLFTAGATLLILLAAADTGAWSDPVVIGNAVLALAALWGAALVARNRARAAAARAAERAEIERRAEVRTKELREELARTRAAERRFGELLESAPDAILVTDANGIITFANREAVSMFGYPREVLVGLSIEALVPEWFRTQRSRHRADYTQAPRARAMGANVDLYALRQDGTEFPVEISLSPIQTADGLVVSTAIRDITRRKQADRKFRALLESAPDAFVLTDERGRIELVNSQTEQLFGYRREELLGQPIELLVPQRFRQVHTRHREGYFSKPRVRQMGLGMHLFGQRKDGTEFPVEVSLAPLQTEDGRTLVSSAIRDVTERKRMAELTRMNEDLQAFAHVASHDLREPLRMISSYMQLLSERYGSELDGDAHDFIGYAVDGARRMEKLLDALLDYARIGSRAKPLVPVDPVEILDDVRHNLALAIEDAGAVITIGDLPRVNADPVQLTQLFQNLIANAIKFRGANRPHVRIDAVRQGELWQFGVHDNGIGIDPRHAERVFGIFERLHTASEYPGTGIGLSICKRIVQRHGGRIWVESRTGEGSHFYFTLPAASSEDAHDIARRSAG